MPQVHSELLFPVARLMAMLAPTAVDFGRLQLDFRYFFAYDSPVDKQRETAILTIAASIVAAIRLRGEPIRPSPKLTSVIADSVNLANRVLMEVNKGRTY